MTGKQIRELRERMGLSQDAFAEKLGLESRTRRTYISHLEHGREVPRGPLLRWLEFYMAAHPAKKS
jgi:transcriptional regulator with XRE-family HTH domain